MKIEMYVGFTDETWEMYPVEIPDDTPEEKIEEIARKTLEKELLKEKRGREVAFSGVYYK